jgi:hypothetical protein
MRLDEKREDFKSLINETRTFNGFEYFIIEKDFNRIISLLLTKEISYEEIIKGLDKIIKSRLCKYS